ncbi:MAG: carboxymuconolactone decarboxylase family protein [Limnohabitans sp.]|nr:carboxymuconolactone decarboxylase family protein [Limnohabitans sp.]
MPHITLPVDVPGIRGPMMFRPDAAKHLLGLAETILRQPASLDQGDRETIAAWTSHLNGCNFCKKSHAAAARAWLGPERSVAVDRLLAMDDMSGFSPKMQALLELSRALQNCVLGVRTEHIERARAAGASDHDIHDTVLITAAFCMYNRYVEGLGTREADEADYEPMGRRLRDTGYQG